MGTAIRIIEELIGVLGIVVWMAFLALFFGGLLAALAVWGSKFIESSKQR
jgi:hypothetical protein